jgi:hypothetical protein
VILEGGAPHQALLDLPATVLSEPQQRLGIERDGSGRRVGLRVERKGCALTMVTLRRMVTLPASRSTASHMSPRTSARPMPVVASSSHRARRRHRPGRDGKRHDRGRIRRDFLFEAGGGDRLRTIDGVEGNDTADGGTGTDLCQADSGDVLVSCP